MQINKRKRFVRTGNTGSKSAPLQYDGLALHNTTTRMTMSCSRPGFIYEKILVKDSSAADLDVQIRLSNIIYIYISNHIRNENTSAGTLDGFHIMGHTSTCIVFTIRIIRYYFFIFMFYFFTRFFV